MNEWAEFELGKLCKVTSSKRIFSNEYVSTGIPFYRSKEIIQKAFGLPITECLFISEEKFRKIQQEFGIPKKDDILISSVGARSGIPYLIHQEDKEFYFKDGNLIWIKDFSQNLNSRWLVYWLQSNLGQEKLESIMIGSAQPALTIIGVSGLALKIPDTFSQRNTVSILSCLDRKISNLRQQNETLESIAQTLFKHWFVDFEFPNEDGKPYKSSGGAMVRSDLGNIPVGWTLGKLGDVIVNYDRKRIPLSSSERETRKGSYPYYGATSIMDYVDDYIFDGTYVLMGEDGTVIDSKGFPILQYVFGKFWVNNHAHVLQGKHSYSTNFVYLILKRTNINNLVTGAVQLKINQANMNSIDLVIPDSRILLELNIIMSPIFERLKLNTKQIQTLTQTRDRLLPKLMSGQLRIPE